MPAPNLVAEDPLELIGNTPVVRMRRCAPEGGAEIWAKLELANPGGSVKDRIARAMIEDAESDGRLRPGAHIVEPTSGNTGIGLALVAAGKGYRLTLTMPDTMSEERRSLLLGYGAHVELTPDTNGMHAAVARAEEIAAADATAFLPQQFSNPSNPRAHRDTTAREILAQMPRIDAFVAGVGTGGTISGVGPVLHEERPGCIVIAVEPAASPVLSGGKPGPHAIQGIGAGFVPENLDRTSFDRIEQVSDEAARQAARRVAREEGILVGISSGANLAVAIRVAATLPPEAVVLTVFCDTGERYLTTDLFDREGI
jgi:cysteine synthase A